jgi:hypothetical protein
MIIPGHYTLYTIHNMFLPTDSYGTKKYNMSELSEI